MGHEYRQSLYIVYRTGGKFRRRPRLEFMKQVSKHASVDNSTHLKKTAYDRQMRKASSQSEVWSGMRDGDRHRQLWINQQNYILQVSNGFVYSRNMSCTIWICPYDILKSLILCIRITINSFLKSLMICILIRMSQHKWLIVSVMYDYNFHRKVT